MRFATRHWATTLWATILGATRLWPGALALVLGGAAPMLPVPPLPPANSPTDQAAPTPDANARTPAPDTEQGPKLTFRNYRRQWPDSSQGFTPGSRFQTSEDRKPIQTPGLLGIVIPISY
jgi:hypothetical protein